MTNLDLIEKKLAFIETCVRELNELAVPKHISSDVKEQRFISHTLQIAIQATQDIASHIVSDQKLGEPATNRELFELLKNNNWISAELSETMSAMIGFRNIIVHGYDSVDLNILKNIVESKLHDLSEFVSSVRKKLPK